MRPIALLALLLTAACDHAAHTPPPVDVWACTCARTVTAPASTPATDVYAPDELCTDTPEADALMHCEASATVPEAAACEACTCTWVDTCAPDTGAW